MGFGKGGFRKSLKVTMTWLRQTHRVQMSISSPMVSAWLGPVYYLLVYPHLSVILFRQLRFINKL